MGRHATTHSDHAARTHRTTGNSPRFQSAHTSEGAPSPCNAKSQSGTHPGPGEILLTRRHFLYGAIGLAAVAAVGGGAYTLTRKTSSSGDVSVLEVSEDAVVSSEDFEALEDYSEAIALSQSLEMDYGTLVWANDDAVAACLLPCETSSPLTQIGLLSLDSGACTTVLDAAVGSEEGFEIYDVRACSNGVVWAEADILDNTWRIYHAALKDLSLGTPVLAEEGTSDWEMPTLAAVGNYAFWQVRPRLDGAATTEDSLFKRAAFGSADSEVVYTSPGRMATAPYATHDGVVITPRANVSGTYYQLTHLDAETAEITDALVLPSSMRPLEAGYGETGFNFSFENIYSYGGGIANLGTYTPMEAVASTAPSEDGTMSTDDAAASYSNAPWFRFARTPSAAPAWCNDWFMVKSSTAVCGVNFAGGTYFALDVEDGCEDYGEYLASTGTGNRVVTYTNINYTSVGGTENKYCLVRIWEAV